MICFNLSKFPSLIELNLEGNYTEMLPDSIGEFLPNLKTLNLNEMNFVDFEDTIEKLSALTSLTRLNLQINEEAQVDIIVSGIPQLDYLNGLPIEKQTVDAVQIEEDIDEDTDELEREPIYE